MVEKFPRLKLSEVLERLSESQSRDYWELDNLTVEEIERAVRKLYNLCSVMFLKI